jgi:hypothetical protein
MLTVLADTYANHWGNMGGRCSARLYALRDGIAGGHRSCQRRDGHSRRGFRVSCRHFADKRREERAAGHSHL